MKQIKKIWILVLGMMILFSMSANAQITFTEPEAIAYVDDAAVGENIIRSQNGTCFLRVENTAHWRSDPNFTIYYSLDGRDWQVLINDVNQDTAQFDQTKAMFMNCNFSGLFQMQFVETEDGYLVLPDRASNENEQYQTKLYVLDKNLQVQDTLFALNPIGRISYLDGIYYLERYIEYLGEYFNDSPVKSEYLCSAVLEPDINNWTKCDGMPVVSDGHILYIKSRMAQESWYENDLVGVAKLYANGLPQQEILYDNFKIINIKTAGGYFIGDLVREDQSRLIAFSKDGVYFTEINIPFERWFRVFAAFEKPDGRLELLAEDPNHIYRTYCNIRDLEESVPQSDLYVQVKDKILGFSTPPVMEDDRTLVPMRFLFEQLGAEVEWDNDTQTATATIKPQESAEAEKAVSAKAAAQPQTISFSIDNTTAQVNGQSTVMDVPARLVNDKTMVPLRFLSEQMGYTVTWDEATNTAIVE